VSPALPPFGEPLVRACSECNASVYLKSWTQRCPHCGNFVVPPEALLILERGVKIEVTDLGISVKLPTDGD